jgi:hypothetical protein
MATAFLERTNINDAMYLQTYMQVSKDCLIRTDSEYIDTGVILLKISLCVSRVHVLTQSGSNMQSIYDVLCEGELRKVLYKTGEGRIVVDGRFENEGK